MEKQNVQNWIKSGITPDTVRAAKSFGEEIQAKKLTTSQIRQVFTKLKSIEAKGYSNNKIEFLMLKPLIAYAAARDKDKKAEGVLALKEKITWALDAVVDGDEENAESRFYNFCKFFEAILAYHRAAGGK